MSNAEKNNILGFVVKKIINLKENNFKKAIGLLFTVNVHVYVVKVHQG